MNEQGECEIESNSLSIFASTRPFLNLLRKKGLKFVFLVVDDLWLYQYHKKKYDGTVEVVFKTISFIEEKQWEVVRLEGAIDAMEEKLPMIPEYNPFSNPTYMF